MAVEEAANSTVPLSPDRTRNLCSDVAEALRLLNVHPHFGDADVMNHVGVAHHLALQLDCPQR